MSEEYKNFRDEFTEYDRFSYFSSSKSPYYIILDGKTLLSFDDSGDKYHYNIIDTMRYYDYGYIELEFFPNYDLITSYPIGFSFETLNSNSVDDYLNYSLNLNLLTDGLSSCEILSTGSNKNGNVLSLKGDFSTEKQPEYIKLKLNYSTSGHEVYINDELININYIDGNKSTPLHLSNFKSLFRDYSSNENSFNLSLSGYYGSIRNLKIGNPDGVKLFYPLNDKKSYASELINFNDVTFIPTHFNEYVSNDNKIVDANGNFLYNQNNTIIDLYDDIIESDKKYIPFWNKSYKAIDNDNRIIESLSATDYGDLIPLFKGESEEGNRNRYQNFFLQFDGRFDFRYYDPDLSKYGNHPCAYSLGLYWWKTFWNTIPIYYKDVFTEEDFPPIYNIWEHFKDKIYTVDFEFYDTHKRYFEFTFIPDEDKTSTSLSFAQTAYIDFRGQASHVIAVNPKERTGQFSSGSSLTYSLRNLNITFSYSESSDNIYTVRLILSKSKPYVLIYVNDQIVDLTYTIGDEDVSISMYDLIYDPVFKNFLEEGESLLGFNSYFYNSGFEPNQYWGIIRDLKWGTDQIGDIIHFPFKIDGGEIIYESISGDNVKISDSGQLPRFVYPNWAMKSSQNQILPWADSPFDNSYIENIINNDQNPTYEKLAMYVFKDTGEPAVRRANTLGGMLQTPSYEYYHKWYPEGSPQLIDPTFTFGNGSYYPYPHWIDVQASDLIRNPNCWYQERDITAFSVMGNYHAFKTCVTLLSPRHGITATHTRIGFNNWTNSTRAFPYMDMHNNIQTVYSKDYIDLSSTDISIIYFNEDVTLDVEYCKFLPENFYVEDDYNNIVFYRDYNWQFRNYGTSPTKEMILPIEESDLLYIIGTRGQSNLTHKWSRWTGDYNPNRSGDSGRPIFMFHGKNLILGGVAFNQTKLRYSFDEYNEGIGGGYPVNYGPIRLRIQNAMNELSDRNGTARYDLQYITNINKPGT